MVKLNGSLTGLGKLTEKQIGKCVELGMAVGPSGLAEIQDIKNGNVKLQWVDVMSENMVFSADTYTQSSTVPMTHVLFCQNEQTLDKNTIQSMREKSMERDAVIFEKDDAQKSDMFANIMQGVKSLQSKDGVNKAATAQQDSMDSEQRMKEVNVWYDFYTHFNDDNMRHADNAFVSNGLQNASVEELHNENCKWFVEVMEHGVSADEICSIMPVAKEYKDEAIAIKRDKRVQQAESLYKDDAGIEFTDEMFR